VRSTLELDKRFQDSTPFHVGAGDFNHPSRYLEGRSKMANPQLYQIVTRVGCEAATAESLQHSSRQNCLKLIEEGLAGWHQDFLCGVRVENRWGACRPMTLAQAGL